MAIINAIKYLGFDPYWWCIKEAREDRINNFTDVVLCLYADPSLENSNPSGYIPGFFPTCRVNGIGLSNDQLVDAFMQQNSSNNNWKTAVSTDNSYNLINQKSQVYQQISNDPNTGVIRFAEVSDFRFFCKNDIIVMNINIYFDTYPMVDASGNTLYDTTGGTILNVDPTQFIPDNTKTKQITWVVDNFYNVPNTNIGEASYFIGLLNSGQNMYTVISEGIAYGDANGSINVKLN